MSYQNLPFKPYLIKLLEVLKPQRVLDLDREDRKIAKQMRETLPELKIAGLALTGERLSQLMQVYKRVYYYQPNANAGLSSHDTYDLVVIHDFLEYVWKPEAIVLLEYLLNKTPYLMLVTPNAQWQAKQNASNVVGMRSSWSNDDFAQYPKWLQSHTEEYSFFLFRGARDCSHSLEEVSDYLNSNFVVENIL